MSSGGDQPDEPRARDLGADDVDPITTSQLERWFGLPSFAELAEQASPRDQADEDPQLAAQRRQILAAVDPALVEVLARRGARRSVGTLEVQELTRAHRSLSVVDPSFAARAEADQSGREYDLPAAIQQDLSESVPQALLRDLHRAELEFTVQFETPPELADLVMVDPVATARTAMTTRYRQVFAALATMSDARAILAQTATAVRAPWADLDLPNRPRDEEEATSPEVASPGAIHYSMPKRESTR
ncbi:MAG: hypothetical protein KBG28_28230 [Kofleriaceae bacterium]|nr:hypothetical protein [Kofleriaceae bacterium]MBP6836254.1 hypothetical protein [Kofleriaceae bacterium]MBP9207886.1 hypothetical protein [Kofleriaceae bacterium]